MLTFGMQKINVCVHLRWSSIPSILMSLNQPTLPTILEHLACEFHWCIHREGEMVLSFGLNPMLSLHAWMGYFWHLLPENHDKKEGFKLPECTVLGNVEIIGEMFKEEASRKPWCEVIHKNSCDQPGHHDHMTGFGSKINSALA